MNAGSINAKTSLKYQSYGLEGGTHTFHESLLHMWHKIFGQSTFTLNHTIEVVKIFFSGKINKFLV
jgi:hypothetical protein